MVPKLHARGSSFRGAAAYLLHDKDRARTSHRVDFTETRNLASNDPQLAWRIMAATAMDQARLKREAGVKNSGRKSNEAVLHLTLSWHPEESEGLTREEMVRAADGALKALGAGDRQVLMVSHGDEPQKHVHLLINRVSPEDGRMLSSSKEKLKLSQWAQKYEEDRGVIRCEERVINNAARKRGEYTRGKGNRPRHVVELEAANSNHPNLKEIRKQQRQKDAELARRDRERKARQAKERRELTRRRTEEMKAVRHKAKRDIEKAKMEVRESFRPRYRARFHEQQAALRRFEKDEVKRIAGISAMLRRIDLRAMVTSGNYRRSISEAFRVFATAGHRLDALRRKQNALNRRVNGEQTRAERKAATIVRKERDKKLWLLGTKFNEERRSLSLKHKLENAGQRAERKTRNEQRNAAFRYSRTTETSAVQLGSQDKSLPSDRANAGSGADIRRAARRVKEMEIHSDKEKDKDSGRSGGPDR